MPRIKVVPVIVNLDGVNTDTGTAGTADGIEFVNGGGNVFIILENTNVASQDVVILASAGESNDGLEIKDETKTLLASETKIFGPLPRKLNDSSGLCKVDFPAGVEGDINYKVVKCPTTTN